MRFFAKWRRHPPYIPGGCQRIIRGPFIVDINQRTKFFQWHFLSFIACRTVHTLQYITVFSCLLQNSTYFTVYNRICKSFVLNSVNCKPEQKIMQICYCERVSEALVKTCWSQHFILFCFKGIAILYCKHAAWFQYVFKGRFPLLRVNILGKLSQQYTTNPSFGDNKFVLLNKLQKIHYEPFCTDFKLKSIWLTT